MAKKEIETKNKVIYHSVEYRAKSNILWFELLKIGL